MRKKLFYLVCEYLIERMKKEDALNTKKRYVSAIQLIRTEQMRLGENYE